MISKRFKNDAQPRLRLNDVQLLAKARVEEKIKSGVYQFERVPCAVCSSTSSETLSEKDRYGLEYFVVVCKDCGLVYTNPRLTQISYNDFYDTEYRKLYVGDESPTEAFFKHQQVKGGYIFEYVSKSIPHISFNGLKVLEVGCGAGGILQFFSEKGCQVKGLDLGTEYIEYGKVNYNLDLSSGTLFDLPDNYSPDLVIYSHVMEHVLDLDAELARLRQICRSNTFIYIEVPGVMSIHKSYQMDALLYFQNAHTYHFTLTSLKNVFEKSGFRLLTGTEYVNSIFFKEEIIKAKPTVNNEYDKIVSYLKSIETWRFLYPAKAAIQKVKTYCVGLLLSVLNAMGVKNLIKRLLRR